MEHLIGSLLVISQTTAIYLGVGSSSLAIASFFIAIYDGNIEPIERRMLGVIYWTLRVAMVLIVLATLVLHIFYSELLNGLAWYIWSMVAILYINAALMTARKMPSKFGPSIQAATWYTLGFLVTIKMFGLYELTPQLFLGLYGADLVLFFVSVNAYMLYLQHKRPTREPIHVPKQSPQKKV